MKQQSTIRSSNKYINNKLQDERTRKILWKYINLIRFQFNWRKHVYLCTVCDVNIRNMGNCLLFVHCSLSKVVFVRNFQKREKLLFGDAFIVISFYFNCDNGNRIQVHQMYTFGAYFAWGYSVEYISKRKFQTLSFMHDIEFSEWDTFIKNYMRSL